MEQSYQSNTQQRQPQFYSAPIQQQFGQQLQFGGLKMMLAEKILTSPKVQKMAGKLIKSNPELEKKALEAAGKMPQGKIAQALVNNPELKKKALEAAGKNPEIKKIAEDAVNSKPKLEHTPKQMAFHIDNVKDDSYLNIYAPSLNFQVTRTGANNYRVKYSPKGKEHAVEVKYAGVHVDGSPFLLAPTPPKMSFNEEEEFFSIENVHDVEKLQIKSDTLPYEMFRDKKSLTKYHVKYEPGQQIHDVEVIYDETPVEQGSFSIPTEMKEAAYTRDQETVENKFGQLDLDTFVEQQPVVLANNKTKMEDISRQSVVLAHTDTKDDYGYIPKQGPTSQTRSTEFY